MHYTYNVRLYMSFPDDPFNTIMEIKIQECIPEDLTLIIFFVGVHPSYTGR